MHSYDALNTYVTDRQQAREQAATTARTGRLLRRARTALGASGPAGSADTAPAAVPVPTSSDPTVSFPVVAEVATGAATGTTGDPAVAVLRTAATAGDPQAA